MPRLRGPLPIVLLTLSGTAFGLSLLESGARVAAVFEERRQGRLERDLAGVAGPRPGSIVTLGQIIRRSANPRVVYELRPRLDVVFGGARVTTSDAGYRGRDVPTPKPSGTYRIVGIGDSYMFGQGVSDAATYLSRLPAILNDVRPGQAAETVNLAVPGFNTVMEVEMLRDRVAMLDPDLILIEIVGNDLDLPNFLWSAVDPWTLRRLFLLDFIRSRLASGGSLSDTTSGLSETPRNPDGSVGTFSRDPDHVPARYASLVGLDALRGALGDLATLGRTRHTPVLALTHGVWFEAPLLEVLAANEIPVLVLRSALRQRARGLGAPDYGRSPLALSPKDLHPSALGHEVVAEELARWLSARIPPSPVAAEARSLGTRSKDKAHGGEPAF